MRAMEVLKDVIRTAETKAELEDLIGKYKAISAGDIDVACEVYDRYVLNGGAIAPVQNSDVDNQDGGTDNQDIDTDEPVKAQPEADNASAQNDDEQIADESEETENADEQRVDEQNETFQAVNVVASNEEIADVVGLYLNNEFVSQQMRGYDDTVWEDCDAEYLGIRNGTYEHVFEDSDGVKFEALSEYKKHLNEYRSQEDDAVRRYANAFNVITANKQSRIGALGELGADKAKKLYRLGIALIITGMIFGLIAGIVGATSCLDGDLATSINVHYFDGLSDASEHLYVARALFITCAVLSSQSGIGGIFVIFDTKGVVNTTIKVTVKDPVSKQKKKVRLQGQAYGKTLKTGVAVCAIALIFVIMASGFVVSARVDYDNYFGNHKSIDGYSFVAYDENDTNDYGSLNVAYITGYDASGFKSVTIPQTITVDNKTVYNVVGIKSLDCSKITDLTINSNVRYIANGALKNGVINSLVIKDNTEKGTLGNIFSSECYAKSVDYTCVYSKTIPAYFFSGAKTERIVIRDASSVESYAFISCGALKELDLGNSDSNLTMHNSSLIGCNKLTTLTLSNISDRGWQVNFLAYMYGSSSVPTPLTTVIITKSSFIPAYAFNACNYIKTIKCKKATSVGNYAFANCSRLEKIYLTQTGIDYINARKSANVLCNSGQATLILIAFAN